MVFIYEAECLLPSSLFVYTLWLETTVTEILLPNYASVMTLYYHRLKYTGGYDSTIVCTICVFISLLIELKLLNRLRRSGHRWICLNCPLSSSQPIISPTAGHWSSLRRL